MNLPTTRVPNTRTPQTPPETTVKALLSEARLKRDALLSRLPAFDLEKALLGHPYVHIFDLPYRNVCYNDLRQIEAPNPGYMIWASEWLFCSHEELLTMFRMADPAVMGTLEMQTTRPVLGAFGQTPAHPDGVESEGTDLVLPALGPGWQAFKDTLRWSAIAIGFMAAGFLLEMAIFGGGR